MAEKGKHVAVRGPRADAERNSIRLLETAKAAFANKGSRAGLDEIARTAGVGTGCVIDNAKQNQHPSKGL